MAIDDVLSSGASSLTFVWVFLAIATDRLDDVWAEAGWLSSCRTSTLDYLGSPGAVSLTLVRVGLSISARGI